MNKKDQIKNIMRVVNEGVGSIRKGSYSGHECMEIAELLMFLKHFAADLQRDLDVLNNTEGQAVATVQANVMPGDA
jgi:hypothetical protein